MAPGLSQLVLEGNKVTESLSHGQDGLLLWPLLLLLLVIVVGGGEDGRCCHHIPLSVV